MDMYFGDKGDSNTLCSVTLSTAVSKRCPNDCSSNGICAFISTTNNSYISKCSTIDSTCYAECQCKTGFTSSACEMTIADQQRASEYRSTMIGQIASVAGKVDDPPASTVNGWVNNLVELGMLSIISLLLLYTILNLLPLAKSPEELSLSKASLFDGIEAITESNGVSVENVVSLLDSIDAVTKPLVEGNRITYTSTSTKSSKSSKRKSSSKRRLISDVSKDVKDVISAVSTVTLVPIDKFVLGML